MLRALVSRLSGVALARPRAVLALSLAVTLLAAAYGAGIDLRTSRRELVPRDDPHHGRLAELQRQLGGGEPLIVAVEAAPGGDADKARLAAGADAVADALAREPAIASVFHRVDLEWLTDHGLYLAPPARVREAADALEALLAEGWPTDWAELNERIAARIEAELDAPRPGGATARGGEELLGALLDAQETFVEDPDAFAAALTEDPLPSALLPTSRGLGPGGRLATRDGRTLFVLATPAGEDDGLPARRALVRAARARAATALEAFPGLAFGITGEPALVVDEMNAVRRDSLRGALLSLVGVTLLALLAFRVRAHALIAVAALAMGVAWSLGAARLELGYLNMITSAFLSTLIGVGIAYAIHPVSEHELELGAGRSPEDAARRAWRVTGSAVVVSAVTTAGAFFAIMLMEFRGFRELGLVAGVGVLLCLVAVLVSLPAMLILHGRRRAGVDATPAPLDRVWLERLAPRVCAAPRTVTLLAAAVTVAAGAAATGLEFQHDLLDLLPQSAESRRLIERLADDSDLSPRMNFVTADSLDGLARLAEDAATREPIARFESVLSLLPGRPRESAAAVRRLADVLDAAGPPAFSAVHDDARLARSLGRLEGALEAALEAAFIAGRTDAVEGLEASRARVARLRARLDTGAADAAGRSARGRAAGRLAPWLAARVERLRRSASLSAPGPDDLPEELRRRLVTRDGRFVGILHPAGDVFEPDFLREFNAASEAVSPTAVGFPIHFEMMSARITGGFTRAFLAGAALVFLVLLADFRSLGPPLLAMIPLGVGMLWLLGAMRLLGLGFNLANLIALPLILGVGIDNGVHVVHRLRLEGEAGMTTVLRHTGRAILVASLTTMLGFGSLALASHRGLASLGAILVLGIGACLVAALVVLPNLLVALGRVRR